MRKMCLFILFRNTLVRRKGCSHFSFCLLLQPYTRKEAKNISKEKQIITSKEDENNTTPFARIRIMSFNFGNDGATQFQGGGYGYVLKYVHMFLLFFLSSVYNNERDDESFWNHFWIHFWIKWADEMQTRFFLSLSALALATTTSRSHSSTLWTDFRSLIFDFIKGQTPVFLAETRRVTKNGNRKIPSPRSPSSKSPRPPRLRQKRTSLPS